MTASDSQSTRLATPSDREIVIERAFNAPRALVFAAWTQPQHVVQWWGPGGFSLSRCDIDLRPGGAWQYVMRGPDGSEYPISGEYHEVTPPERLVYSSSIDAASMPKVHGLVTVLFGERGAQTVVTMTTRYTTAAERETMLRLQMREGMEESWARLEAYLAEQASG